MCATLAPFGISGGIGRVVVCASDDGSIKEARGDTLCYGSRAVWVVVCLQVVACRSCIYYYWWGGG
jgi:hypothetical protein